jgi:hypothetical protein
MFRDGGGMRTEVGMQRFFHGTLLGLAALTTVLLAGAPRAQAAPSAAPFTVDSTLDEIDASAADGRCETAPPVHCTLRAAVMQANTIPEPGITIILPSGTYTLTRVPTVVNGADNGDLNLTAPAIGNPVISIVGAGALSTIIDADRRDRAISVAANRTASISGVTIRNGLAFNSGDGGGISNAGVLTVSQSILSDNDGVDGGGLANIGELTVNQSSIIDNQAIYGGGLYNDGTLHVNQSTVRDNHADYWGGGLMNDEIVFVSRSTLNQNDADQHGGGIYNANTLYVIQSTLSGNSAKTNGGGLFNYDNKTSNIYNSTIVFNDADHDIDQIYGGSAGGVYNGPGGTVGMRNTLIAGNTIYHGGLYEECAGTLGAYGRNLIGTDSDSVPCTVTGDPGGWGFLNALATLGPLQNNGGPTWTHALLRGSNAIDAGDPALGCIDFAMPLATDQRGAARVVGVRCDIGAFEFRPPLYLPFLNR